MLLGLTAATMAGAWSVYVRARAEARDLFDYQMQLMARSFPDDGFGHCLQLADDRNKIDHQADHLFRIHLHDALGHRLDGLADVRFIKPLRRRAGINPGMG